jgi:hypothetical protein
MARLRTQKMANWLHQTLPDRRLLERSRLYRPSQFHLTKNRLEVTLHL